MAGLPAIDVEHCPACGGKIPPEAGLCPGCGLRLFETDSPLPAAGPDRDPVTAFVNTRPVFAGTPSEVMAMQAGLGARGFRTLIQDDSTKVIDPFVTGGYCLGSTLLAPEDQADAIAAAIAEDAAPGDPAEPGEVAPDRPEEGPSGPEDELRDLGRRIGWCGISGLFAPVGFVFAWLYFRGVLRLKRCPRGFALALGATLLCIVNTLFMAFWYSAVYPFLLYLG